MKIIKSINPPNVMVEFQDEHRATVTTAYQNFKAGHVKNPYDRTVFGIGYRGEGQYATKINGKNPTEYTAWKSMLQRCYSEKSKEKYPAYYKICTVCDEWQCYQNFAKWFLEHQYFIDTRLELDKDILYPGNKIYCPERYLLIPQRLNLLFTRSNKADITDSYADHVLKVLDEYRGMIPADVYSAIKQRVKK